MISEVMSQTNLLLRCKSISYGIMSFKGRETSEKAGAAIFLYFFHSSPSEATILRPKTASALY